MTATYPDGEAAMRPTNNKRSIPSGLRRQQGFATLFVSVILLVAITLITFTNARTSLVETQMTNNEYRAVESKQAAEAALSYGMAWYEENASSVAWGPGASTDEETANPTITFPTIDAGNGDTYALSVAYSRNIANTDIDDYVLVTATAEAQSDDSITATASQYVMLSSPLNPGTPGGPPLLTNGCLGKITGTPDIYPLPAPDLTAIASTQPNPSSWTSGSCLDPGAFTVHGGLPKGDFFGPGFSGSVWDKIFGISRDQMKNISDSENAASISYDDPNRTIIWHEGSHINGGITIGGPNNPVIVIMSNPAGSDCPKLNGNATVYGILFYDAQYCKANGWGGANVYGSVIFDGDLGKFNANAELKPWASGGGTIDDFGKFNKTAMLPGTWRDF